jgi:transposase
VRFEITNFIIFIEAPLYHLSRRAIENVLGLIGAFCPVEIFSFFNNICRIMSNWKLQNIVKALFNLIVGNNNSQSSFTQFVAMLLDRNSLQTGQASQFQTAGQVNSERKKFIMRIVES